MNENIPVPPPGDFRLAVLWAVVTLGLAVIKKIPFGKKKEEVKNG